MAGPQRWSSHESLARLLGAAFPSDQRWEVGQALQVSSSAHPTALGLLGFEGSDGWNPQWLSPQDAWRGPGRIRDDATPYTTRAALLAPGRAARPLARGVPLLEVEAVSRLHAESFARSTAEFLFRSARLAGGAVPYQVMPPQGELAERNLLIVRPLLASWSMVRWAQTHPELQSAARSNLRLQLKRWRRSRGPRLWLEHDRERPLGALAFVVLAIDALPGDEPELRAEAKRLLATLHASQALSGALASQVAPAGPARVASDRNQNFYPPEAMLCLARRFAERHQQVDGAAFRRAFQFYSAWFWRHPDPAFVPWFVQACTVMAESGDPRYADGALRCQDWHLDNLQPFEQVEPPDMRGGLVARAHRSLYGRTTWASSCGVHMEGLVAALRLAQQLHQPERRERYRRALMESLRFLMQMQYAEASELYWLPPAGAARLSGGIRSTPLTGAVQVDNNAHVLCAMISMLATLSPDDFHCP